MALTDRVARLVELYDLPVTRDDPRFWEQRRLLEELTPTEATSYYRAIRRAVPMPTPAAAPPPEEGELIEWP